MGDDIALTTDFIPSLYHAQPIHGYTWLHGTRNGRMVHVGGVEAPVTVNDVQNMAVEFKKSIGTGKDAPTTNGIDVLGWEFSFESNEIAKQQARGREHSSGVQADPAHVMGKRAVAQGDIQFFELAALAVKTAVKEIATLTLTDFVIPPDDVPEEVLGRHALVAMDRLLGRGLDPRDRHVPQPVADIPHTQKPEVGSVCNVHVCGAGRVPGSRQGHRYPGNDTTKK